MEKSIESIWNTGFIKSDALIAPKLNDLYNQKSIDIVEKFRRMYKINIIAIGVFALIFLPISFIVKLPYMGIPMFVLFMVILFFGTKFKSKLDAINKNTNSYEYLNTFDNWTKEMINFNTKLSRYLYPYVFLSMVIGFWFGSFGDDVPGDGLVSFILKEFPNMMVIFGIPIMLIITILFIVALLAFFGGRIGKWDVNIAYGRILKRLDILLSDMEELRRND